MQNSENWNHVAIINANQVSIVASLSLSLSLSHLNTFRKGIFIWKIRKVNAKM